MQSSYKKAYFFLFLKSLFLIASLCLVIYAIYFLKSEGLEKTAVATLLNPEAQKMQKEEKWNLCKKDLYALSYYENEGKNSWKLLKAKEGWRLLYKKETYAISDEDFNKCSQKICQLHVFKTKTKDLVEYKDRLTYSYMDASQNSFRLNEKKGLMFYQGETYQADGLLRFLKSLAKSRCK